ncbi:AMP-binding enzyme [Streptomyces atratus]|uniref:AMP-binding enzyme n=1 Tax=Streptomyces atratus TaxID=1893 RepID=UPI0033E9F079
MLQDTGATLLVYGPELAERALELRAAVPEFKLVRLGGPDPAGHLDLMAAQCAVVGAPDTTWVEAVTAFVTLRPGAEASEAALRDHVRARPAGYKVPKTVHFVETIPYSPVGRILCRALRDPLWEGR